MDYAALFCRVDPAREADRKRLRGDHLAYIAAHRDRILVGGPTLTDTGVPETMVIVIHAETLDDARAFIAIEPYTAHQVFSDVQIRAWNRVLPEAEPGTLDRALAAERAQRKSG